MSTFLHAQPCAPVHPAGVWAFFQFAVFVPGEKPQRIFEDLQGSLKTCKDLQKIFEDEDLSRILKGSLKDL